MGSISLHKGMRVVDRFNQEPFYIVTGKMNGKFMAEVDRALDEIRNIFSNTFRINIIVKVHIPISPF